MQLNNIMFFADEELLDGLGYVVESALVEATTGEPPTMATRLMAATILAELTDRQLITIH